MKVIAIIILIIVFIYGVLEMNKSSKISEIEGYMKLNSNDKRVVIQKLKKYWKTLIILLAITIAMELIVLSTYMGNGTNYDMIISIVALVTSVLIIFSIVLSGKNYYSDIKKYFS